MKGLFGLGGFYNLAFAERMMRGLTLGPISPATALTIYFVFSNYDYGHGLQFLTWQRDWLARVPGT